MKMKVCLLVTTRTCHGTQPSDYQLVVGGITRTEETRRIQYVIAKQNTSGIHSDSIYPFIASWTRWYVEHVGVWLCRRQWQIYKVYILALLSLGVCIGSSCKVNVLTLTHCIGCYWSVCFCYNYWRALGNPPQKDTLPSTVTSLLAIIITNWTFYPCVVNRWEALGQLTVAFSILGLVYWLSVLYDAPSRRPCVSKFFCPPIPVLKYFACSSPGSFLTTIYIYQLVVILTKRQVKRANRSLSSPHMGSMCLKQMHNYVSSFWVTTTQ